MISKLGEAINSLGENAKSFLAIAALMVLVVPFLWWLVADELREGLRGFILGEQQTQCVAIPATGHTIETAPPGKWATVTWVNVNRQDDCGPPDLTAVVVNGDGIYHDVETSTQGVNLPRGITPSISYKFLVPKKAEPGRAWFQVTLNFPEKGRTINTPRLFFTIPEAEAFEAPNA